MKLEIISHKNLMICVKRSWNKTVVLDSFITDNTEQQKSAKKGEWILKYNPVKECIVEITENKV